MKLLEEHDSVQLIAVALSWGLQLSIVVSCFLFLAKRPEARWLAYVQTPFRALFILPSVSIVLIGAHFIGDYSAVLIVFMVVLSKARKCWTLWRLG